MIFNKIAKLLSRLYINEAYSLFNFFFVKEPFLSALTKIKRSNAQKIPDFKSQFCESEDNKLLLLAVVYHKHTCDNWYQFF